MKRNIQPDKIKTTKNPGPMTATSKALYALEPRIMFDAAAVATGAAFLDHVAVSRLVQRLKYEEPFGCKGNRKVFCEKPTDRLCQYSSEKVVFNVY